MKKCIALLAVLLVVVTLLTACGGPLVGTWNVTVDTVPGQMILKRNGTGKVISHGVTRDCTWYTEEDKLTVIQDVNGIPFVFLDQVTYIIEGDTMTVTSQNNNTLVFTKE